MAAVVVVLVVTPTTAATLAAKVTGENTRNGNGGRHRQRRESILIRSTGKRKNYPKQEANLLSGIPHIPDYVNKDYFLTRGYQEDNIGSQKQWHRTGKMMPSGKRSSGGLGQIR
jgi:hypothetical protein